MSWEEALRTLEETTAQLAAADLEGAEVQGILSRRGEAVFALHPAPPDATQSHLWRLRAAAEQGQSAVERLRLKRAATRSSLAKLRGEAYRLRRLHEGSAPRTTLDITA